jgi:hypothetical protein
MKYCISSAEGGNEKIKYLSAPASSGKTMAFCGYVSKKSSQKNFIYVAPTIQLLEQTEKQLLDLGVKPNVITSKTHDHDVVKTIMNYVKDAHEIGNVLLITWNAFELLPYMHRRDLWEIFIDEVPNIDVYEGLSITNNFDLLKSLLRIGKVDNKGMAKLLPIQDSKLRRFIDDSDDMDKVITPLVRKVLSINHDVFVNVESWEGISDGGKLHWISMLNPKCFIETTVMGANIESSLLFHWMSRHHNIEFVNDACLTSQLRFRDHSDIKGRLRVSYYLENSLYSKTQARKFDSDTNICMRDRMDDAALNKIGSRDFLYVVNHDHGREKFDELGGERLSVMPHGLNCYVHHNVIYFCPALNRSPMHMRLMDALGLDRVMVRNSTVNEAAYQAVMRTALRDISSDAVVECIVPDKNTAQWLCSLIDGVGLECIGTDIVDKKPLTGSERNIKCNDKKILSNMLEPNFSDDSLLILKEKRNENLVCKPHNPFHCALTFHSDFKDMKPDQFTVKDFTLTEYVRCMRKCSKRRIGKKSDNELMLSAVFNMGDTLIGGVRRQDNFIQSSMMILDFDGGDLSVYDFERIFHHDAEYKDKCSFLIYNSFNRSIESPNYYRVCLFYKKPVVTIDEHKAVYRYVIERLEKNGYGAPDNGFSSRSGLDVASSSVNQSYYLPVTNMHNPDGYYFNAVGYYERDISKYGIDPSDCIKVYEANQHNKLKPANTVVDENEVDFIRKCQDDIRSMMDTRRRVVFDFGCKLINKYGFDLVSVKNILMETAGSDKTLIKHAKSTLDSLMKYGY